MEKNVGGVDRILRIIVGLGLTLARLRRAAHPLGLDRRYPASFGNRGLLPGLPAHRLEHLLTCLEQPASAWTRTSCSSTSESIRPFRL